MLCPTASGRVSGVPDLTTGGWQHEPKSSVDSLFDSLLIRKEAYELSSLGPGLNSTGAFFSGSDPFPNRPTIPCAIALLLTALGN